MRRFAMATAVFLAAASLTVADDASDKALKEIAGEYKLKVMEEDGQPGPKAAVEAVESVEIKGDVLTIVLKSGKKEPAKIKLDSTKSPAWIDLMPEMGDPKKPTLPGIYKFEKGELTIVVVESGERPKEFKSAGKDRLLLVFAKKGK